MRPNQSTAQTDPGRIIYSKFADSVLLVFVEDDKGQPVALGSAFLVDGGRIITNAHVVRAGKPFLQFGPAKVPATIEKIDADADLAILRTAIQVNAAPIPMAETLPQPGDFDTLIWPHLTENQIPCTPLRAQSPKGRPGGQESQGGAIRADST